MRMKSKQIEISKFLSYVLRHKPESIGLELDERGWASVERVVDCAVANGMQMTCGSIIEIVMDSDKQRFCLSEDRLYIRANQGHSIRVDLGLEALIPPEKLFHGTATRFLESIFKEGLQPQRRQHVHLSNDMETAIAVGKRHGVPVVLEIASGLMHEAEFEFFRSANGVWLTDRVPPEYLKIL